MDKIKNLITNVYDSYMKSPPPIEAAESMAYAKPHVGTADIVFDRRMCEDDAQCMRDRMMNRK
jgi:hypothetical protein